MYIVMLQCGAGDYHVSRRGKVGKLITVVREGPVVTELTDGGAKYVFPSLVTSWAGQRSYVSSSAM